MILLINPLVLMRGVAIAGNHPTQRRAINGRHPILRITERVITVKGFGV
jgi:hypothetical protein